MLSLRPVEGSVRWRSSLGLCCFSGLRMAQFPFLFFVYMSILHQAISLYVGIQREAGKTGLWFAVAVEVWSTCIQVLSISILSSPVNHQNPLGCYE